MKNIAIIDCGSNSFRLLIVKIKEDSYQELYRDYIMVKLGESLNREEGLINHEATKRATLALESFRIKIREYNCEEYYCYGTSAFRTAINAEGFIQSIYNKTGLKIEVISEKDEALYSYIGAKGEYKIDRDAVLDIGGGSTELIYLHNDQISSVSLLLGAARLKNVFWPNKLTPFSEELFRAKQYIKRCWGQQNIASKAFDKLIGVAGTITTLAAIDKQLDNYCAKKINNSILTYNVIENMLLYIMQLTEQERCSIKGMFPPERAHNIIAGILILLETMKYFEIDQIQVKSTCLLEGVIIRKFFSNTY